MPAAHAWGQGLSKALESWASGVRGPRMACGSRGVWSRGSRPEAGGGLLPGDFLPLKKLFFFFLRAEETLRILSKEEP